MAIKPFTITAYLVALLALAGCATVEPFPVTPKNPILNVVRNDIAGHQHQTATWGGTILDIQVHQSDTLVSVLARPLDKYGEPQVTDSSDGRFLARFKGFRDPVVFSVGRRLTVTGSIAGSETRKIGNYFYVYPLVDVSQYRLWPVQAVRVRPYDEDYWWYDPWFYGYPGYPWYPIYYPPSPPVPRGPPPVKK